MKKWYLFRRVVKNGIVVAIAATPANSIKECLEYRQSWRANKDIDDEMDGYTVRYSIRNWF